MNISDLLLIAERDYRREPPPRPGRRGSRLRFGQALSNALSREAPVTYSRMWTRRDLDQIDPFYNDDNVTAFISFLIYEGWRF